MFPGQDIFQAAIRFCKPVFAAVLFSIFFAQPLLAAKGTFGDQVWHDLNVNGIQDDGEPGVAGVTVTVDGKSETTDAGGFWTSAGLKKKKNYTVTFSNLPSGYEFSPRDAGGDDNLDSDPDPTTGITIAYNAQDNLFLTHIDAGIYLPPEMDIEGNGNSIGDGDTSPAVSDDTQFGSVNVAAANQHTFTIFNSGDLALNLTGSPLVEITGAHTADFTVSAQPSTSSVANHGGSETFSVQFSPTDVGLRTATVSIANDDDDENPYTFSIEGTGVGVPEMDVSGNSYSIANGNTLPSLNDDTFFGFADIVAGMVEHTFTISNSGSASLDLNGSPRVLISGTHAVDFTVSAQPDVSIGVGGSSTFQITFDPSAAGARNASVSISNNDSDENPYTFDIQGTGTSIPEIDVQGNSISIPDGDASPSSSDYTNFGESDIYGGVVINTFVIHNSGSGDLSLTGSPMVQVSGSHPSDFTVNQQPASSTVTAQGGTQTFQITFDPTTTGLRQATISVSNTDANESPYTFAIQGSGTINPEIDIHGNGVSITDGDFLPTVTDSTDFGTSIIGSGSHVVRYTIHNTGPATLNLTGTWPLVDISGSHSGDFSVYTAPSSSIAPGGSSYMEIAFDPITSGTRSAVLTINNNDLDEGIYTFSIQGTGQYDTPPLSEITIQGNLITIPDGDSSPGISDGTDFGSIPVDGGSTNQTFIINNDGSEDLVLTSSPAVIISGAHAGDFAVTQQPSSPVAPSGSVPFVISFNPSDGGIRSAYLSIENNDADESPYTFTIQGNGLTEPEISILGNNLEISTGDASPSQLDSTYFGDVTASLGVGYVTYTIQNSGSTTLNLTGSPRVNIMGDATTDFTVTTMPPSSISAGGSAQFVVAFDPIMVGLRTASISITSDDADESPYTFAIQGSGSGPGSPLACVPNFFHIFGDNGTITYLDATTSPYTYTTIATAGYHINGVGYNLEDGLLYGFEMDDVISGNEIVRIDGAGTITVLTSVTIPYESWRADFNDSGEMYFWNGNGDNISIFDASTGSVTSQNTGGVDWVPIDMAYLDTDGNFYGIHATLLYKYDPQSNSVSTSTITGPLADGYNSGTNSAYYGAAWSANDGYIYTTNSQSGHMYKINVSSGTSLFVGQAEANLQKSDGASCPLTEAPLPETGSLGNFVWIDADGDGVQDVDETGLPDVRVSLYGADNPFIDSTTTDANGEYHFYNLSPSEYYLKFAEAPPGFGLTSQDQGGNDLEDSDADPSTGETATFFVQVGGIQEGWDAGYTATGVGDYVWLDVDEDGVQDLGESGIPGIDVEIREDTGPSVATTTTDGNGYYFFTGLTAGTAYRIYYSNIPAGYVFTTQDAGGDDAIDSDSRTSDGRSNAFTLSAGEFNSTIDAGLFQQTDPEINITGNGVDIPDGDASPQLSDDTDFGSALIAGATVVKTFTIENLNGPDLSINGTPMVEISGTNAADFSLTSNPTTPVSAGNSTTFQITFDPSEGGLRTAVLTISNTDANENPYDFSVQGTGLAPEIEVFGNSASIANGDTIPTISDSTDFGGVDIAAGVHHVTFTISNTGDAPMLLTDSTPYVSISGSHASDFSISTIPAASISNGVSTNFVVRFDPSSEGLRTAVLTFANTDTDENPFSFEIQGTGTSYPEMEIQAGAEFISDGDTSPWVDDSTDFADADIFSGQITHTFTIRNTGSGNLSLSGLPMVQLSGINAGDFIITQQPASNTIPAAGTATFQVTFNPTTTGIRTAIVSISNDDSDENPYTFAVQGLGTSTLDEEIEVLGNDLVILNGDNTPSASDFTDLGTAEISGVPTTAVFVIRNIGYAVLSLTGPPPYVSFGGTHASEFSITSSPSNSVAIDSATTSFEVTFTPAGLGTRQATLSIQNDDADENPYTFTVQGSGIYDPASQSEIEVRGNFIPILDGDSSPDTGDGTDFGSIEVVGGFTADQVFVIHNLGIDDLVLGSFPMITITGTHANDFTITSEPASPVAPSSSVTMTIEFDPAGTGTRSATINIGNSDQDENPFTFDIQGTGTTAPEMSISGNGIAISNGDNTPSMIDSTYFGDVDANLGKQYVTYTIDNSGSSALSFTGSPKVTLLGDNAADFTVTTMPASPVNPGNSTTFVVEFDPAIVGMRNATISITSNDPNESPYLFAIQGNGTGPGSPLACVPNFFQIFDATGTIAYLDASTDPYTYTTIATAGYSINAVGYNLEDGLLYGFERGEVIAGDYMVRIDATGDITVLSSITIPFSSWVGDFNDSGDLYFLNPGDKNQFGIFDVSEGTVTTTLASGGDFLAADMAYLDADGKFYGVQQTTLYVYNPVSNSVSTQTLTGKLTDDYNAGANGNLFGASWSATDGYVYVSNNTSGLMYKINVNTNETVYVGQAIATSQNDAASCPLAESPLPSTGTLGNKVWLDSDGDGIQDAGEDGFAGVTVSLYDGDDTFLNSLVTVSDGAYLFENLAPSQYYLMFTNAPSGFALTAQNQGADDDLDSDADPTTEKTDLFTISAGMIDHSYDAGFKATGVGDYVWLDVNEDGIQDPAEEGIPGIDVEIKLDPSGTSVGTTTTDAKGFYLFSGLTADTYKLFFTNLPAGYVFAPKDQGGDDNLDSDINSGSGESDAFSLISGVFNSSIDAGMYQQSEPEINVTGNYLTITDGDVSPSTQDYTDFGSVNAAIDSVKHIFMIHNVSGADLTLNGNPRVVVSGAHASEFTVTSQPGSSVVSGDSTGFEIRFIPNAEGLRSADISIANTDANENPYNFSIRGFGLASEIQLEGNSQLIVDGDTTANALDHTDFGSEDVASGSQSHIFTILNTGNANLVLVDPSPHVVITGDNAADFTVTNAPVSPIASNNTSTFTVTFDPTGEGTRTATVSLANNDLDEDPYTFRIKGQGTATPEVEVQGRNVSIADGDNTPSAIDNTDFGSLDILTETQVQTFKIHNTGSGTLSLTSSPIVLLSGVDAGDFLINLQPAASTVSPGDSIAFEVTFDPTSVGIRTANLSIDTDDSDENPFNFAIQGIGIASSEINLLGNGISILSGDLEPSVLDSTVFDSTIVDSIFSVGFTIENQGSAILNLTDPLPYVTISGANSADFSISAIPSPVVSAGGGTTEFRVTFIPLAEGDRTATISISSDDPDENPYSFAIKGFGLPTPQPTLTLIESVDLEVAAPGDTLTYTVVYANIGEGAATSVVVDEEIPNNSTYLENSATGVDMSITYSHDNGGNYDISQTAPVTNIKYERITTLASGGSGVVIFKVVID